MLKNSRILTDNTKGFLLLEVLASLAIVSLIAVNMLGAFLPAAKWLDYARKKTVATYFALAVIEFYREEGAAFYLANGEEREFVVTSDWLNFTDDSLAARITFCGSKVDDLYHIKVDIFWGDNDKSLQILSYLDKVGRADA